MTRKKVTWSGNQNPPIKSGDYIIDGNMSQWKMDTPVLKGKNNLTFENVNLRNIKGLDEGNKNGKVGKQNLVLNREIDPKDGQEWLIFQNNIRCKGCLIMQKDVPQPVPLTAKQEEAQRFEHAMENLFFDHGGEDIVVQKIADKYGYARVVR